MQSCARSNSHANTRCRTCTWVFGSRTIRRWATRHASSRWNCLERKDGAHSGARDFLFAAESETAVVVYGHDQLDELTRQHQLGVDFIAALILTGHGELKECTGRVDFR